MTPTSRIALTLLFIPLSLTAFAQAQKGEEPNDSSEMFDSNLDLNEIVVTATRAPRALKNTPVQTRLISA